MYTYPEALEAFHRVAVSIASSLTGRKFEKNRIQITADPTASTACVNWVNSLDATWGTIQITLPLRNASARITEEEFNDWVAYLVHEEGHPFCTDRDVWNKACSMGHKNLVNALEDVRMEKVLIDGGQVANVKGVLSRLLDRKLAESKPTYDPSSLRDLTWTFCVLGRFANGYAVDGQWVKDRIKTGGKVARILDWAMPALAACTSTQDCLDLAVRVADACKKAEPKPKPPAPKLPPLPVNPGPTSPTDASGEASADEAPEDAPDAFEATGEAPEAEEEGEKVVVSGGGAGGDIEDEDEDEAQTATDEDFRDVSIAPVMSGEEPKTNEDRHYQHKLVDIIRGSMNQTRTPWTPSTPAIERVERMTRNSAKCGRERAIIARALKSNEEDDREGGLRVGRLARGGIVRSQTGDRNVFSRRSTTEGHDTDVMVLVDGSGSMDGAKCVLANEVALVIAQAAASVGVSCGVEQFKSGSYYLTKDIGRSKPEPRSFAASSESATGGTPLSENIARIALAQAKRAGSKRRIVFLITDGGCNHGQKVAAETAKYCENAYGTIFGHVSIDNPLTGAFRAEVMLKPGPGMAGAALDHFANTLAAL